MKKLTNIDTLDIFSPKTQELSSKLNKILPKTQFSGNSNNLSWRKNEKKPVIVWEDFYRELELTWVGAYQRGAICVLILWEDIYKELELTWACAYWREVICMLITWEDFYKELELTGAGTYRRKAICMLIIWEVIEVRHGEDLKSWLNWATDIA